MRVQNGNETRSGFYLRLPTSLVTLELRSFLIARPLRKPKGLSFVILMPQKVTSVVVI